MGGQNASNALNAPPTYTSSTANTAAPFTRPISTSDAQYSIRVAFNTIPIKDSQDRLQCNLFRGTVFTSDPSVAKLISDAGIKAWGLNDKGESTTYTTRLGSTLHFRTVMTDAMAQEVSKLGRPIVLRWLAKRERDARLANASKRHVGRPMIPLWGVKVDSTSETLDSQTGEDDAPAREMSLPGGKPGKSEVQKIPVHICGRLPFAKSKDRTDEPVTMLGLVGSSSLDTISRISAIGASTFKLSSSHILGLGNPSRAPLGDRMPRLARAFESACHEAGINTRVMIKSYSTMERTQAAIQRAPRGRRHHDVTCLVPIWESKDIGFGRLSLPASDDKWPVYAEGGLYADLEVWKERSN